MVAVAPLFNALSGLAMMTFPIKGERHAKVTTEYARIFREMGERNQLMLDQEQQPTEMKEYPQPGRFSL